MLLPLRRLLGLLIILAGTISLPALAGDTSMDCKIDFPDFDLHNADAAQRAQHFGSCSTFSCFRTSDGLPKIIVTCQEPPDDWGGSGATVYPSYTATFHDNKCFDNTCGKGKFLTVETGYLAVTCDTAPVKPGACPCCSSQTCGGMWQGDPNKKDACYWAPSK